MARCPFAIWHPLGSDGGAFTGGPFKIVHHTTEGSTAAGAFAALGSAHAESHFVVDEHAIYQLIDTAKSSRSLRNKAGGVQTNRDSAIQIEMVGFAGRPKNRAALANVRRLCRWIEETHGVPHVWPAGYPPTTDRGPFPRDAHIWDSQGGYFGHSQVPENTHWDPAFSREDVDFLMADEGAAPSPVVEPPVLIVSKVRVTGLRKGDMLNLRAGPGASTRDIGDIPNGYVLDKLGEADGWVEVRTPYGIHGWVKARYVVPA